MNSDKIFELIMMIDKLKPLYPAHETSSNYKMLTLIDYLEKKLIVEIENYYG